MSWLLLGRRRSRRGIGLVVFTYEIFGDVHGRRHPDQKITVLGDLAFQRHYYAALLAILIEELVDFVQDRPDHFLAAPLEECLIVFGLSLERFLQLRPLFHPAVTHGRLSLLPFRFHFLFQILYLFLKAFQFIVLRFEFFVERLQRGFEFYDPYAESGGVDEGDFPLRAGPSSGGRRVLWRRARRLRRGLGEYDDR